MNSAVLISGMVAPLLVLVCIWTMPYLTAPTLPFGVRVPATHTDDPVIVQQRRSYHLLVGVAGGSIFLVGLILAVITGSPLVGPITAVAQLCLYVTAFIRARAAIRTVKEREDWYRGLRQAVAVDTSLRTKPERFPWPWAVPAVLIVVATAVVGVIRYPSLPDPLPLHYNVAGVADRFAAKSVSAAFLPVFIQIGITTLLLVLTRLAFRSRADIDPARPATSALQYRRFLVRTGISLLILTACADLTLLLVAWQLWSGHHNVSPIAPLIPILAGTLYVIGVAVRSGQGGSRIEVDGAPAAGANVVHRDDDRLWRAGGLVYANRQDPALFVPKRVGIGWTVNFGNPQVLLLFLAIAAFVLVIMLLAR